MPLRTLEWGLPMSQFHLVPPGEARAVTANMPCRPVVCSNPACHIEKATAPLPVPGTGLPQAHILQLGPPSHVKCPAHQAVYIEVQVLLVELVALHCLLGVLSRGCCGQA